MASPRHFASAYRLDRLEKTNYDDSLILAMHRVNEYPSKNVGGFV
jgi:hypothetical protein